MARYYLLTRARTASGPLFPGALLDDLQEDVAAIVASGAKVRPAPDSILAEASARCTEVRLRGGAAERAEAIMLEAAARSESAGASPSLAPFQLQLYRVPSDSCEADVVAVGDGAVVVTDVGLVDLHVVRFVFPDPWTGGDVVFSGSDRSGASQTETLAYPGVAGGVDGLKVFAPVLPLTATTSTVGTGANTGHVQFRNALCVPAVPVVAFRYLVVDGVPTSLGAHDLARGWVVPSVTIGFNVVLLGYDYRPVAA